MTSDAIRKRQLQLVEGFKEALLPDGVNEEDLFLPEKTENTIRKIWEERSGTGNAPHHLSLKERVREKIFSRIREDRSPNKGHVSGYDRAIMPLVKAMIDEYLLCQHWDRMTQESSTRVRDYIFGVKAQIACHYAQLLQEQGYGEEQAVKVVGVAIRGFTDLSLSARLGPAAVTPERLREGGPPSASVMIGEIKEWAGRAANYALNPTYTNER